MDWREFMRAAQGSCDEGSLKGSTPGNLPLNLGNRRRRKRPFHS